MCISRNAENQKKKDLGCVVPLYGEKAKCVLQIVPEEKKCDTLQIDKKCIKKEIRPLILMYLVKRNITNYI